VGEERVSCGVCGTTVEERPVTWSMQVSARGTQSLTQWICDTCTRDNVRSIEGKLDEAWW
jgi:hypothetical protein